MNDLNINLKDVLRNRIPELLKFVGEDTSFSWASLNKKINKYHIKKIENYVYDNTMVNECSLLDVILIAIVLKERSAILLLNYIRKLFENLNKYLIANEKLLLRCKVYDILINFDHKYLNFLGEFSVLCLFCSNSIYTLLDVEYELPSGKKIDYLVRQNEDSKIEQM